MDVLARRRAYRWLAVILATALAALGAVTLVSPAHAQQDTLRDAAGNMLIGTAVTPGLLNNSTYANIAGTEFSSVTAENDMKWETVQPNPGQYNFGPGNQIIQFANQNNQNVYGHTLVWHSQAPGWLQGLSGQALDDAMQDHITTVMQQWPNIQRWDVVNESVSDNNGQLRDSFWMNHPAGAGYIEQAFQYARAANPSATLCLNDYSIDGINAKSNAYFSMVQDFIQRGVPIDCMSFQAHLILGQVPGDMLQNLQRFANLGLEIWVTELDIRIPLPVTQQDLEQQAQDYAQVTNICLQAGCAGLTVWGLHDAQSWVDSTFPEFDSPLLWDDNMQPKPAYFAVLDALGGSPPPTTTSPPPTTTGPPPTTTSPPPQTGDCAVSYQANDWGGSPGFTASVTVTNTSGTNIDGWTLTWNYTAGQSVDEPGWNATVSQSGTSVTATNAGWNGTIAPGGSANFGFNGAAASIGNNPAPTGFTLNGTSCST